jgi:endogenous inhibitor of DNA gyrase (YacG/DUF329 family)
MESANNNKKCPICKKAAEVKFQPFCSKRCADVDLGRWLKGSYVIPGESTGIETESEEGDY